MSGVTPRERPAWTLLEQHYQTLCSRHLRELFAADPDRGKRLSLDAVGVYLDYSKNRITDETLKLLPVSPSNSKAKPNQS